MPTHTMPRPVFHCQCGDHAWTALTRGYITLISPEDVHLIEDRKWYALITHGLVYAARKSAQEGHQLLHRLILDAPKVDHKNGHSADNRKENLRSSTHQQNMANNHKSRKSGFKGVRQRRRKWEARITVESKGIFLGYHSTPEAAARAYDEAATKHFGEFASLNFPQAEA